ncbi:hypothetical protein IFM89_027215 [Coptis chinensis]|uniref:Glyoxysomal processing protease, glyoxysomal n=1 Tax=Coptis chinensis TaxID=261450 RepID=A0A835LEP3_9MAGN|nr:hypothetical protein IFM89_027215 [Coptis chinensis]
MELPQVVELARKFAVMVRTHGPDPKGLKMQEHAFHRRSRSGKTAISASGMLLPEFCGRPLIGTHIQDGHDASAVVVTVASIVEPFVLPQYRDKSLKLVVPELIPGAQIDVMVEVDVPASSFALQSVIEATRGYPEVSSWEVGWSLASLNNSPQALMDGHQTEFHPRPFYAVLMNGVNMEICVGGSYVNPSSLISKLSCWWTCFQLIQVGHDIRYPLEKPSHSGKSKSRNPNIAMSTIRVAFLGVPSLTTEGLPNINISRSNKRGDLLLAMGSPFGLLSPAHFINRYIHQASPLSALDLPFPNLCIETRMANCFSYIGIETFMYWHHHVLLIVGMEGGPIFSEHAEFIGILNRPLRVIASGAEIQLVIPWEAIALALSDLLQNGAPKEGVVSNIEKINALGNECSTNCPQSNRALNFVTKKQDCHHLLALRIEKAIASVALVTVGEGTWASGVVLNNNGLILTNAHLLEPGRFHKTNVQGSDVPTSDSFALSFQSCASVLQEESEGQQERQSLLPNLVNNSNTSLGDDPGGYKLGSYKSFKRICVRLDHMNPWIWCDAKVVYISNGPLDIALLQLESFPKNVCPIVPDFTCPSPGSKAYVIGHGLFGPRSGEKHSAPPLQYLSPSVCSGVVARVVKSQGHIHPIEPGSEKTTTKYLPAMLETTASVYGGGSGGAIVNSNGEMIGLVTSNARFGKGHVIPQMNFSIPCAALEPVFKFSEDMQDISVLQDLDRPDEHLSTVWALTPPESPRKVPPFLRQPESLQENNTEKKGSRFAKFIAERNGEVFLGSNHHMKEGNTSKGLISSKL